MADLPWSQEVSDQVNQAVHSECTRTKIAAKFLPMYGPIDATWKTVPSDSVVVDDSHVLNVDEGATTPIVEIQVQFLLTKQQIGDVTTAITLATRAANLLSQAEDLLIFQGQKALNLSLFKDRKVQLQSGSRSPGAGLVNLATLKYRPSPSTLSRRGQTIHKRGGENTFAAVANAYSILQSGDGLAQAHYGPYVAVLHDVPYADTYAPLATTLIMPADRIKPLVTEVSAGTLAIPAFFGTGTLPQFTGLFLTFGGNTMDLVIQQDATAEFVQMDPNGRYRFRVFERFAVREKDPTAVVVLKFGVDTGKG